MLTTSEVFSTRVNAVCDGWNPPATAPAGVRRAQKAGFSTRFKGRLHRRIEDAAAVWTRLQSDGHATAYQRLDWVTSIATHLAGPSARQLLFVEIVDRCRDETILLLPFALKLRFGVRIIGWVDCGVCDYAAPLVGRGVDLSAGEAAEVWTLALSLLPAVDLVDIRQVPAEVGGVPNPLTLLPQCRETTLEAFGVALEGDPQTQIRRLMGSKGYRHVNRQLVKLSERGTVRLIEPTSASEVEALFSTMVEQRRQRFRDIGRFDILNTPAVEAFYLDMALRSLRDDGPAKLFGMAVGDEIVATTYMLVHGGSMHGIILSIGSAEWSGSSPGFVIAVKMIEWAAARRLSYFDMTVGSLPYKSRLGGKARALYRLLEPRSPVGRLAASAMLVSAQTAAWLQDHPRLYQSLRAARQTIRRLSTLRPER